MAEVVEIDIPGVGKIEAKNAATEATLKELVLAIKDLRKVSEKADKDQLKATKEQSKGGAANTGGTGGAKLNKENAEGAKNMAAMNRSGRVAASSFTLLGKMGNYTSKTLGQFGSAIGNTAATVDDIASSFKSMSNSITDTISDISQIGDSLQSATNALRGIPVVGGVLSSVLGAAVSASTSVVDSFQKASSVGATFGGSVNAMARAASGAGMTIDQFAGMLAQNGENLMLLGGNTADGAKRFSELSKVMRSSGVNAELMRMGYSTKDINQGIMNYASTMGRTGQLQRMSTAQLASESGKYMKELDALAKVTGVSREEKQREVDLLKSNAKVQAAMAGIEDPEQRRKMQAYILSFPKEAQGAIADMISTGNMSTEEAVKLGVMLPGVAKEAMQFGRTLNAGGKITDQQINQSKNNAVKEAQSSLKRNKTLGLYADDLGNAFLATGAIASQGVDAYAKSLEEQKTAAEKSNMAEEVEKAKQQLAEISNQFMLFLASSGAIDTLMTAFQAFTSFAQAVLMPAFSILSEVLNRLVPIVSSYVVPMFQTLGDVVLSLSDFIFNNFEPVMIVLAAIALPSLIAKVTLAGKAAGSMALNLLRNVGALALMAIKMLPLVLAAGALYLAFKGVVWIVENAADGFAAVTDGVKWLFSWLKTGMLSWYKMLFTGLSKLPFVGDKFKAAADGVGEMIEEEEKTREEIAKRSEERTKKRAEKEASEEQKAQKRKEEREKGALDRRSKRENKAIDDKAAKESASDTPTQDLSDPVSMLKSFADRNNSEFTKDAKAADKAVSKEGRAAGTTPATGAEKTTAAGAGTAAGTPSGKVTSAAVAESESKNTASPALSAGLEDLVRNGINPTTIAFQNLNKKAIAPMMETGIKFAKLANSGAPTPESIKVVDQIKSSISNSLKSLTGQSTVEENKRNAELQAELDEQNISAAKAKLEEENRNIELQAELDDQNTKVARERLAQEVQAKLIEDKRNADLQAMLDNQNLSDVIKKVERETQEKLEEDKRNAAIQSELDSQNIVAAEAKIADDKRTAELNEELQEQNFDAARKQLEREVQEKIANDKNAIEVLQAELDDQNAGKLSSPGIPKLTTNTVGGLENLAGIDKLISGSDSIMPAQAAMKKTANMDIGKNWISEIEKDNKAKKDLDAKQTAKNSANTDINPLSTITAAGAAQDTPESLLSSLNMKLAELIRVSKQTADINSKQLSVQRNNSGDLFA